MRKASLVMLILVLLVALAVPAMAADEPVVVTVTPSATTVYPGQEVAIAVSVKSTVDCTAVGYSLEFDSAVFEYVKYDKSSLGEMNKYDENTNKILVAFEGAGKHEGTLGTLTLKVKDVKPTTKTIGGTATYNTASSNANPAGLNSTQVMIGCEHDYTGVEWTKVDADTHQRICTKCSAPETQSHKWNDGKVTKPADCDEKGEKTFECTVCKASKTEDIKATGHKWSNDCDTSCNNKGCDETRETEHKYEEAYTSDETGHWHKCSSCGVKQAEAEPHTPGAAATEEAAQTCTVCQYVITPAVEHVHEMSTQWISDAVNHWHRCEKKNPSCYYTEDKAPHDYDNDCDVTCNTCGYIREAPHDYNPEWQGNAEGHWNVCKLCGAKSPVSEHTPGAAATQEEGQVCTDCNFQIKCPLGQPHKFGEKWYSDELNHWQCCSNCTETQNLQPHSWDEGTIVTDATDSTLSNLLKTCTVCGAQVTVDTPVENSPSTAPTEPTTPADDAQGGFPWEIAGIGAVILLIAGIALLVVEFMRSKKINMHGKFSK